MDHRIDKLADLLVRYSIALKPKEKVLIQGSALASPLLSAIYAAVLKNGGYPFMHISLPGQEEIFYRFASDDQLMFLPPPMLLAIETFDASISVLSDNNTRALSKIDPAKISRHRQGRRQYMDTFLKRAAEGSLKWVVTLFPTDAYAQDAEMSLLDFEEFVYRACMPDEKDPVLYWQTFSKWQEKLCRWLEGKKRVRIVSAGTDLRLSIENRRFINCDGHHNMPDGEIFTGPEERSVEGYVTFSYPAIYEGREVSGIRLVFKEGRVVEARAEKNEDFLQKIISTDEGASYVGEFALGTNKGISQFTREILFDEKIGGTFHLALGAGYPETGSRNRSAIHWDMICDLRTGGEVWVDDFIVNKNGCFVLSL
ncbi:MAG: aminopeptidase [Syntrophales bacterium]|nr:aminopeptidase [Syntrophales bacterium]